jgi:hypothetical protein
MRRQVAVQRGPIVYCVESADAPCDVDELYLPSDARFFPEPMQIDGVFLYRPFHAGRLRPAGRPRQRAVPPLAPRRSPRRCA